MEVLSTYLSGLSNFGLYFGVSLVFLFIFKLVYVKVTPHDEWKLVKEDRNTAAAIGFIGAVLGFSLALAGAASNSVSITDFAVWGVIALLAQLIAFALVRWIFVPGIVKSIVNNEVPAGIILAGVSVSVGLLNAACMTY